MKVQLLLVGLLLHQLLVLYFLVDLGCRHDLFNVKVLPVLSVVLNAHILNEVALVDLPFQLTFMFLSDAQLLILNVVGCGFHSLFSFDVLLPFLLESRHCLLHLRLHNILLEDLVQAVLILVDFLYVSALCLVSPADVGWRESANLFPVLVFDLLSRDLLLKELLVFFL